MSDPNLFAQWLRRRRKALRLTQADLAERAGLSFSAVQKLEGGQRKPSQQVARLLADVLRFPPVERARFLRLAQGEADEEGQGAPPPSNLPAQLTALVGRAGDLDRITASLKEGGQGQGSRLFTLTGPPGIGKTRLAVQAGSDLLPWFRDGVFLVELAPIRDPALVLLAIAGVLGLRGRDTEPLSLTLKEHLRERKMLLVLDNFEHMVAAAPAVVELLWGCPHLKILVTSREAPARAGRAAVPGASTFHGGRDAALR
jgi:transcriptional regulator with XRE-family HTH domain